MFVLSEFDILNTMTMTKTMDAMEHAFISYKRNHYQLPRRIQIAEGDHNNTLLLMPSYTKEALCTKLVTVFPQNSTKGKPVTQGLVVLNDVQTGEPLAIFNGAALTALRTGALGGVSIRYLACGDAERVGLIGTGVQGLYQLLAACEARNITSIYLYNRTPSKCESFIEKLKEKLTREVSIFTVDSPRELVENSDIIIAATTSFEPVFPNDAAIVRDKHIIGVGSYQPMMQEFPQSVYESIDYLFIDTLDAIHETGDIITPLEKGWLQKNQVIPFSEVVSGFRKVHREKGATTAFKSVGMALFDAFVAQALYEEAKTRGIGQIINL